MNPREYITPVYRCHGKMMYDKRGAITAANKRWDDAHVRLRIYECNKCRHWHITHVPLYGDPPRYGRMNGRGMNGFDE